MAKLMGKRRRNPTTAFKSKESHKRTKRVNKRRDRREGKDQAKEYNGN